MVKNWEKFLLPYHQAVNELMVRLYWLKKQFAINHLHNPIEAITGRVKSISSIKEKMRRRYIAPERLAQDMEDIAGLRIICPFIEDIYALIKIIRQFYDINIVEERDYVKNQKASGYQSYHIIFEYRVQTIYGAQKLLVEIQLRTLAMNFWSTIDHILHYKHSKNFPDKYEMDLQETAQISFNLDREMSKIRRALNNDRNCDGGKKNEDRHF